MIWTTHTETHRQKDTPSLHQAHLLLQQGHDCQTYMIRQSHSGRRSKVTFIHAVWCEHKLKWPNPSVVSVTILWSLPLCWGPLPERHMKGNHNFEVDACSFSHLWLGFTNQTYRYINHNNYPGLHVPGDDSGIIVHSDFSRELEIAVAIEFARAVKGRLRLWSITAIAIKDQEAGEVTWKSTATFRSYRHTLTTKNIHI